MAEDLGEKTEAPSGRKLSQARSRGQIARSQELSAAVDLIGAVVLVIFFGQDLVAGLTRMMKAVLGGYAPGSTEGQEGVARLISWSMLEAGKAAAPVIAVMFAIIYAVQFYQVRWLFTLEPLQPNLARLNPMAGLGRLFGRRNVVRTALAMIKLALVLTVVYVMVQKRFGEIAALPMLAVIPAFAKMGHILLETVAWILLLLLAMGVADYVYQRWQHTQDLRMTKHEVKDERRSAEGDPEVKGRRMKMARSMLLQQVRSAVPTADVIVTNPTHFSVAIKYDAETMAAPRVVAKGADYMAFRIREVALASGVPIVEKPALARLLYAKVEVGQEVRPEYYQAVAEVLAYVYRIEQQAAA
jgi:flagellar biosynthesis protein FlhB